MALAGASTSSLRRLQYARWTEVTVVLNETAEPLVRTLVPHYERMGGVPLMGVFDWSASSSLGRCGILFAEEVAHRAQTRLNRLSHAAKFPSL
jgi:hypothetical protein